MKKLVLLPLLMFALLISCSKEKKIERNLYRKDGLWEISNIRAELYNSSNRLLYSESYNNAGTIVFNKDGSGRATELINNRTYMYEFEWTNTDKEIFITIPNKVTERYKILDESKNSLEIQKKEPIDNTPSSSLFVLTYRLERKK